MLWARLIKPFENAAIGKAKYWELGYRLPSSRCIESAQSHRAQVRALLTRASDTALGLIGTQIEFVDVAMSGRVTSGRTTAQYSTERFLW